MERFAPSFSSSSREVKERGAVGRPLAEMNLMLPGTAGDEKPGLLPLAVEYWMPMTGEVSRRTY